MVLKEFKYKELHIRAIRKDDIASSLSIIKKTLGEFEHKRAKVDFPLLFEPRSKVIIQRSKRKKIKLKDTQYTFAKAKVAIYNKKVVGICGIYRLDTHVNYIAGIDWFAIDPRYQRLGIGRRFMKWVLSEAEKDDDKILFVWEAKKAEPFYKKFGFKRSQMKISPRESSILLVKKL